MICLVPFLQDKLEISIYLWILISWFLQKPDDLDSTCCVENSVDPDKPDSSEASWSG